MENKTKYRILLIILGVFLMTFGVFIGLSLSYNDTDASKNYISKEDEDNKEVYNEVDIYESKPTSTQKYNIEVVYKNHYTLCNETIEESETIYDTTLEEVKEKESAKQKQNNMDCTILEESNDKIIYLQTLNRNCPNHFNIKLEEGNVVIYNIVSEGVNTLYKTLDVTQELLRPELIEELNIGIRVDSKEDLNLIIEDIES